MDVDAVAENWVWKQLSKSHHLYAQKLGPFFQIFNSKVRLGVDVGSTELTWRRTALEWKVSLNSNNAIACVHIGMEVGDLSPTDDDKILNAY